MSTCKYISCLCVTIAIFLALAFLLLTFKPNPTDGRTSCFQHKDCYTCVQHKTWSNGPCTWCSLDNACHAKWSPRNDCMKRQNVRSHFHCFLIRRRKPASHYNPQEALKLAKFSAMAYSDTPDKCLEGLYPTWNVSDYFENRQECDDFLFDYTKQCMAFSVVHHEHKEIIVSYRGTRGNKQVIDQVLNILGKPSVPCGVGGKVQQYFDNVHDRLYFHTKMHVKSMLEKYPNYTVKFTGHSLGGAAASITSGSLVKEGILKRQQVVLYTFGMPRVGNKYYAEAHDNLVPRSWRVVRDGDKVARFPPCRLMQCSSFNGPYHHKSKVLYTDSVMMVNSSYRICNGNEQSNTKCKERVRPKRGIVDRAMNIHKYYFDIPIGTYCVDHVLKT